MLKYIEDQKSTRVSVGSRWQAVRRVKAERKKHKGKKEIINIIIGEALPRSPAEPHTESATELCNRMRKSFTLVRMDITDFIVSQRQKALLVGDYGSYRKQLSRRLLVVRRKLNYTSVKGHKYAAKSPVSVDDIAQNHEFVSSVRRQLIHSNHLQICTPAASYFRASMGPCNAYENRSFCGSWSERCYWIYEEPYLFSTPQSEWIRWTIGGAT